MQRDQTKQGLARRRRNAAARRCYRKKADRLFEQGFTARGAARKTVDTIGRKIGERYYLEVHGVQRNQALRQMWRERHQARGLTADGKPRRRQSHHLPREMFNGVLNPEVTRANARARWKIYSQRRIAAGLNAHNRPRKDGLAPSALELRWREFRSTIQIAQDTDWSDRQTYLERSEAA